MACMDDVVWVPQLIFWPGLVLTSYLVARHTAYGVKDALFAAVGMKTHERTTAINLALFGTIFGSLCLAALGLRACPG